MERAPKCKSSNNVGGGGGGRGKAVIGMICEILVYYHCAYKNSSILTLLSDIFLVLLSSLAILGLLFHHLNIFSMNSPSKLGGWKSSGGNPCGDAWDGIECKGSSVSEIKLLGLELTGSMGYQLSSLTSVTYFDLSQNNLKNDIPYQLPPNADYIYFLSSSLLLVECRRVKIVINFCFYYPRKNHGENFCF